MKKILLILISTIIALQTRAQKSELLSSYSEEPVFTSSIDVMPEFKGGMDRFYARLKRIPYTLEDRMNLCQGRVTLIMVIEKDGSMSNFKIVHGFSEKQDKEIIRVVKGLSKWKPGMKNGQPVRVLYSLPINFKIIEDS